MIIKLIPRHGGNATYGALARYIFKHDPKFQPLITQHLKGDRPEQWIQEYRKNNLARAHAHKKAISAYHEILSFHQRSTEKLSEETLRIIAEEYAHARNPHALVLAKAHYDTDNVHIHFLISGTQYAIGKATRISKNDLRELKAHMQTFQRQFPELDDSIVQHGKKQMLYETRGHKRYSKEEISAKIHDLYIKSMSRNEFIALLKSEGFEMYSRTGKDMTGVICGNEKYRFSSFDFDISSGLNQLDAIAKEMQELESLRNPEPQKEPTTRLEEMNTLLEPSTEFPEPESDGLDEARGYGEHPAR